MVKPRRLLQQSRCNPLPVLLLLVTLGFPSGLWSQPVDRLSQADRLQQQGEYEQALTCYREIIRADRKARDAYLGQARTLLQVGRYQESQETLQRALEQNPQDAVAYTLLGELAFLQGHYPEAEEHFQHARTLDTRLLRAQLQLALLWWETGRRGQARAIFQDLLNAYQQRSRPSAQELTVVALAAEHLDRFHLANRLFDEATRVEPTYLEAYLHWGELFLEKYNRADAIGVFRDALKINPNSPQALVGLAACLAENQGQKTESLCRKALQINPNLTAAHQLLATLYLVDEEYPKAITTLHKALTINPNDPESQALLAASLHAQGNMSAYHQACARALAINPGYGYLYYTIAEQLTRRYRFSEATVFYEKAIALDPELWIAYAGLGINWSRLGNEEKARGYLQQAFAKDPFNVRTYNVLNLFDRFADFVTLESPHFLVRLHKDEQLILGPLVLDLLEQAYQDLGNRYQFYPESPVLVEIFPTHDDFAVRISGLPGAGALLGVCFGKMIVADSPKARSRSTFNWAQTLWHEYAHVVHLQLTDNRLPRWLAEGIAVYEAKRARPCWDMDLDVEFARAVSDNRLLKLAKLNSGFTRPKRPEQVVLVYYQSSVMVEFIVKRYGFQAIRTMLEFYQQGKTTEAIFSEVLATDLDTFDRLFAEYVDKRTANRKYLGPPPSFRGDRETLKARLATQVNLQSDNFTVHLQLARLHAADQNYTLAIKHFKQAKALFPRYVAEHNPYQSLAAIYIEQNQPDLAVAELESLITIDEDNLAVRKQLANLYQTRGNLTRATEVLRQALEIDPYDLELLVTLGNDYEALGQPARAIYPYQGALVLETVDRAAAHCRLARVYLRSGQKERAKAQALAALELAPSYAEAQDILLQSLE